MITNKYSTKFKDILTAPTEELGKFSRFIVFQIKLWAFCLKLLKRNRCSQQAAALSYHTIFGIIPLAIVMLLIFQTMPTYQNVGDKFKLLVYDNLQLSGFQYPDPADPDQVIILTDYIDDLVDGFFQKANKGSLTFFSGILVIWAAIGLLTTIEKTFNIIWNVLHGRNLIQRIFSYWTPLTLGPLLLGAGIYITTHNLIGGLEAVAPINVFKPIMPYIISVMVFFILIWSIPNTKVNAGSALWGAAVSALIWTLFKWFFKIYLTKFIPYSQIYGVLGLIPVTVMWIYLTWKIILFGVQLSYTTQNLSKLDSEEIQASQKDENYFIANDQIIIMIMSIVAKAFNDNKQPIQAEDIYKHMNLPNLFTRSILDRLVSSGLLFVVSDPTPGYVLAKNPDTVKLSDITKTISADSLGIKTQIDNQKFSNMMDQSNRALQDISLAQIITKS